MAVTNRFGAWANLTDMENVKFELVDGNVEFHIGELELAMSVATLDAWITAAQDAQREVARRTSADCAPSLPTSIQEPR
jgi:hypothetical protein